MPDKAAAELHDVIAQALHDRDVQDGDEFWPSAGRLAQIAVTAVQAAGWQPPGQPVGGTYTLTGRGRGVETFAIANGAIYAVGEPIAVAGDTLPNADHNGCDLTPTPDGTGYHCWHCPGCTRLNMTSAPCPCTADASPERPQSGGHPSMLDVDIYSVGVLSELRCAYRAARIGRWREARPYLKRIPRMWGRRNAWNGYLAEPRTDGPWTRAGHGWTRRRAYTDLMWHMRRRAERP